MFAELNALHLEIMEIKASYRKAWRLWWLKLAVGVLSVVFGFWVLSHPLSAYLGLTYSFCFMLILVGGTEVANALVSKREPGWLWNCTMGAIDVVFGVILVLFPDMAWDFMPYCLSFMLMFMGIELIGQGTMMKVTRVRYWFWVLLGGSITLVLAFMIIFHPLFEILDLIIWTSASFIIGGITSILFAWKIRK